MKKHFSIITSLIFIFTLFFSFGNITIKNAFATSPAIIQSGTLQQNTNINYTLNENGLLTISGTGIIPDDYDGPNLEWAQWKNDITSIVIESGITGVGDSSFFDYTNLTKVTLADSVQIIDIAAFALCTSLTEINFPNTISEIKMSAFEGCSSLEIVTLPNGITKLSGGLFKNCTNLKTINIPNSVQEFDTNIFFGCTSLKTLTLPKNITTIHKFALNGSHFEKIYIPCDSTFEFNAEEYVVGGITEDIYLSDTNVELLESHTFGNWQNIDNNKKQRECACGHTETADISGGDNKLNITPNKNSSKKNGNVSFGTAILVIGGIFALAVGTLVLSKRIRRRPD